MRTTIVVAALALVVGCGSQVVLFPEDSGVVVVDSGDAGNDINSTTDTNLSDTSNLTDTNNAGDVVGDTNDTGSSDGATEDANDASDGSSDGNVDANDGAVEDASDGFDTGSDTNDPCANVVCPEAEVCQNGVCVCDGHPQPDAGCDDNCGFDKALLCHYPPGNPGNEHNICVGEPSVQAHLAHGDKLGCCQ